MGKKKSKSIAFQKGSMQAIGKCALFSEGMISKDMFLKYSTQGVLDNMVSSGHLVRKDETHFQTTEKFNHDFRKNYGKINDDYSDCKFSQSRSINHSQGLLNIFGAIDRVDLIKDNVKITSGGNLSQDWEKKSHMHSVKDVMKNIYQENVQARDLYMEQIKELQALDSRTKEQYSELFELENACKRCDTVIDLYEDKNKEFCSPPDVELTLTADAYRTMIDNLQNKLDTEQDDLSRKEINSLESVINQMESYYEEQVVTEGRSELVVSFEITTDNYSREKIIQKELIEQVTETKIIYYKV